MQLHGKTIVITGAAQGLGRAMAETLAGQGANLALVDVDEGGLRETAELCAKSGGRSRGYAADVTNEQEVEALFKRVHDDFGGIDALVNNAGITRDGLLVKARNGKVETTLSLEAFRNVITVDLTGVFLCGREAAVWMIEGGKPGVIVNISSISRAGNLGQTNYSAAKAGVAAMTVVWAKELASHGIRVAAIAPGFCDTRLVAAIPTTVRDRIVSAIPLRRLARPDEIAQAALFVLQNDYLNGRVLDIDGGLRL
ncbi:3-oxoacyl-[acyl-carrier protein] reductase [Azospirillum agricola]|uniref:SDR family oxidoreductase n=1 Tax=Azospirillum agricola TaxID=1720247 RepID=UPI001AE5C7B7|nr:SDR family oxidoreductase [Azospirillum agricola]MBP2233252.1 3-oxoacyl-[acyl-carrier protein] reductase [Azospirillum agricola]